MATGDKKRAVMTTDINNAGSDYPVMPLKTIDSAPDATHTGNLISSAAVAEGLAAKADKTDLASIQATGTTNTTGATITAGTYFYLDGVLVQAITDIGSGATFTSGTNYETITAGALNSPLIKAATDGNDALSRATSAIIVVGTGTVGTAKVALSLVIPKIALDTTQRYWQVSDCYNNSTATHLQVLIASNLVSTSGTAMYYGSSRITDEVIRFYYI